MSGGECWTADGRPKRRFDTRSDAKQALARYRAEWPDSGLETAKPYRCGVCGYFHLGHYPSTPQARAYMRARHTGRAA